MAYVAPKQMTRYLSLVPRVSNARAERREDRARRQLEAGEPEVDVAKVLILAKYRPDKVDAWTQHHNRAVSLWLWPVVLAVSGGAGYGLLLLKQYLFS